MPHMDEQVVQDVHYAKLEARIDRVADNVIRKKWKKLPSSTHHAARDALSVARQQARSRGGKNRTSQAVEDCVDDMLERLHDRLPRIPYPPSTDESYFDHEANINRANKLKTQLAEDTHVMKLLKQQIANEEENLAHEEEELQMLRENAKSEESARNARQLRLHPLAKDMGRDSKKIDLFLLSKQELQTLPSLTAALYEDTDLQPALEQLDSHLSSMSHNAMSIMSVNIAVDEAREELMTATNT